MLHVAARPTDSAQPRHKRVPEADRRLSLHFDAVHPTDSTLSHNRFATRIARAGRLWLEDYMGGFVLLLENCGDLKISRFVNF
jgi:hypothetical protein